MFRNYLKISVRNLWKNKKLSSINIFGLATGIACSLLIFLFVRDEISYDRYHKDADNIYRVVKDFINDDGSRIPDATSTGPLAPAMQREIPELLHVTRISTGFGGTALISNGDKKITESNIWRVDSSFFDVFTFPFVKGDPKRALNNINSVILTESAAKRYFGKEDPVGKILRVDTAGMMVTGVVKDVPANSHFHFNFLMPFRQLPQSQLENWNNYNIYTYIKVREGTNPALLNKKIQGVYERNQPERYSDFYVQRLTDIHLTSHLKWEIEPNSDRLYVYVFTIIGIFILLIAAINYINLSTARSSLRAKEIGIRKVSGAKRKSLIWQFLLESVILCLIASFFALVIAQLLLPAVNNLTQKELTLTGDPLVFGYILLLILLIGFVAGLFPAFYLSSFKPVAVLKGLKIAEAGSLNLRKALVVVQFSISIALIIGALIIAQQMKFIQSAKLGFDKEQVVVVKNAGSLQQSERAAFLNELKQLPFVQNAASAGNYLGEGFSTTRISKKGSDKQHQINFTSVSYDYLDVMGLEMKEGRGFSPQFPADTMNNGIPGGPLEQVIGSVVINETAVRDFGLESPVVGKQFQWARDGDTAYYVNIIGVMKDFHFTSLKNEIKPFGFVIYPNWQNNFVVKLAPQNIPATLQKLENLWSLFSEERAFEYVFLDETFAKLYASEARFQKVFISLVVLGIIIACLGLFALATFAAERRIKEIGIRKVLGASVISLVALLSKDFLKLVFIALFIAVPLSWWAMNKWLDDFAYRIGIHWWVFVVAAIIALVIAFLTISSQAIRAAMMNPVKNLRTE